jgi:hypothetical protein
MKDTVKLRWALGLFVALSFAAIGVACDDSDDAVVPMADAGPDTAVGGGDTAKPGDTAGDAVVKSVPVGTVCSAITDCGGITNYCLKNPPTAATGTCNVYRCDQKPMGTCPMGTKCIDVHALVSAAPVDSFFCIDNKLLMPPDGGTDAGGDAGTDAKSDAAN